MSIESSLNQEISTWGEYIASVVRVRKALETIGITEIKASAFIREAWDDVPSVTLSMYGSDDELSEVAKKLVSVCGRVDKGFDAEGRKITLSASYNGIKIIVSASAPSTCTIEPYEEEVQVPAVEAQPATIKKVKKYRLVGDCEPLLSK